MFLCYIYYDQNGYGIDRALGGHGVMVIVIGNGHGKTSSKPRWG